MIRTGYEISYHRSVSIVVRGVTPPYSATGPGILPVVRAVTDLSRPTIQASFCSDPLLYSARVGMGYRVVGIREGGTVIWFWIGTHADYDQLLSRM